MAEAGLKLSSCLRLPSAGITDMCYHVQLRLGAFLDSGLLSFCGTVCQNVWKQHIDTRFFRVKSHCEYTLKTTLGEIQSQRAVFQYRQNAVQRYSPPGKSQPHLRSLWAEARSRWVDLPFRRRTHTFLISEAAERSLEPCSSGFCKRQPPGRSCVPSEASPERLYREKEVQSKT